MAVLSNKPDAFVGDVVHRYFPGHWFASVRGARPGVPMKPDPAAALQIAAALNLAPSSFLYVGDTNTDMQTARAAGMVAVGALWGFRTEEELRSAGAAHLIAKPHGLLGLLDAFVR
jgi:phosphoglycolate phosphatase